MTRITIYRNQNREVERFSCTGHAGYAASGNDIVCASISVLVINTINSIETFTSTAFICEAEEETGDIDFRFTEDISPDASLLIESMILGLKEIQNDYGKKFLTLDFKEV
ncbi:MAG: ribosomal-processing cysteine protease Prp [Lachnospiraceae bacterium]|nr:ribosomal-processing cysteine protease Prp [Lachnospiraceae bacterium]